LGLRARRAWRRAPRDLGGGIPPSKTDHVPLVGAAATDPSQADPLRTRHGACAEEVAELVGRNAHLGRPLPGAERYIAAEAVHACTHQGALDLDDVLSRRTRVSIEAADRGRAAARVIAPLVGEALGWSDERTADELRRYERLRDAEEAAETAPDDATAIARYRAVLEGDG
jgi:glycerol-3-phosphate dehydrogenase